MNVKDILPPIGMRKLKSLLSIFVGFWLWQIIRLFFSDLEVHPIYIYLYGLIEIRDTSEKTVELGSRRIKATITGIAIALPLIALMEFLLMLADAQWYKIGLELILLLVGVLLTLTVAEKVGCKTFCGIAALIYIIMLINHANDQRYLYSVLRAGQTVMGVFLAWLINVKMFPFHGKRPKDQDKQITLNNP